MKSALRVALLGSMANNLYNACCNLRALGVDAVYFVDGLDNFAMGQPIWEETPLRLSTEDLYGLRYSVDEWLALTMPHIPDDGRLCVLRLDMQATQDERRDGMETESGRVYAFRGRMEDGLTPEEILGHAGKLGQGLEPPLAKEILRLARQGLPLIRALSTFDVIVASKYNECLWACLTGKPVYYAIYGADFEYVLENKNGAYPLDSVIFRHLLEQAAVVHGPLLRTDMHHISRRHCLLPRAMFSAESRVNLWQTDAPRCKASLRTVLGLPTDAFVVLMPSRTDSSIKGTDAFLRAFSVFARECPHALLLAMGWGNDLADLAAAFPHMQIRFLDHVLSKPLLFDHMAAADMVVDQFVLGAIGSTGREALALGRPLLAFVDTCYQWAWPAPMPLCNAANEAGMLRWLRFAAANPAVMQARGEAGRQWLLTSMNTAQFASDLHVLAKYGAEKALSLTPTPRVNILEHAQECPRGQCSLQVARWPWPYTAGLSIANSCEFFTWEHLCALHSFMANKDMSTPWGRGLGLPFSDSLWFYDDSGEGLSWFRGDGFTPTAHAPHLAELVNMGFLDTVNAWGGFGVRGAFRREHALRAAECLTRLKRIPDIFTNHGNAKNYQNIGGRFAQDYHQGDVPGAPQYHADILRSLGVRWFWGDEGSTSQCSLLTAATPLADDGICKPDARPWSGQLFYRNRLRDGQYVRSFRRLRSVLPQTPCASTLAWQITPEHLNHLEAVHGGMCVDQHLGCWRDAKGKLRPFAGQAFPSESLRALEDLAARYHAGRIWVAPLSVFLRYVHAVQHTVAEPVAHGDWLEIKLWFTSGDLEGEDALAGLTLLLRTALPVRHVRYEDTEGVWREAHPLISTLDDGRQLVRWPWPDLGMFPFTGRESTA